MKRIKNALLTIFGFFLLFLFLGLGIVASFESLSAVPIPLEWYIVLSLILGALAFLITELRSKMFGKKEKREKRAPKGFLKKCIKCGREVPIASEECQYCGSIQY